MTPRLPSWPAPLQTLALVASYDCDKSNHFKIKVIEEECKDSLLWWKVHDAQFSYVRFVDAKFWGLLVLKLRQKKSLQHCKCLHKPLTISIRHGQA